MPFLSETLYCALPGKNKSHLAHTKFLESNEVCLLYYLMSYIDHNHNLVLYNYFFSI